jgi:O-antigen ligase
MRDRLALHILQVGAVAVVLAAVPYKVFDLDRYFVPKELVLHVAAGAAAIALLGGRKRLALTPIDLLLLAFIVVGIASSASAINLWAAERALAISVSGILLFWSAATLRRAGLVRGLIVALAVGVVVGAATSLAQAYGVQTEYFSLNRAPGGTFGNRNFVAHLCAIGTPVVALAALTARRGVGSLLGAIGMALVAAALVLSRSRAAWLAVLVLAVPVGILGMITWSRWSEPRTVRRLMLLGVAVAAGALAAVLVPNHLEWKSDNPYLESAAGLVNYKEGSGHGRIVQYTNSLKMTAAHPMLGVGPGNWPVAYPKFASHNDPSMSQEDGVTSNPWPSSDWVAYLSERGIVGFALLLLAMLGLVWRAVRDLRSNSGHDAERILTAIALVGTLAATAVVGAFDAVLLTAVPTFFVWTLAGALSPPSEGAANIGFGAWYVAMLVVFGVFLVSVARSTGQLTGIALFSTNSKVAALDRSSRFDPGNYRIHTRVAQAYLARGDCTHARPHARAARSLFPSAAEPRRQVAACGGK